MLPPGGRISTTPAIRSSPTTRTPVRSLSFINGERTPPASARVSSLIPRPVSQKKPTKRTSRVVAPPKKTSSENVINVKPQTVASTLEGEEVQEADEPPPTPPPVEGERERDDKEHEDREEAPEDLDRTLQQDMIAEEINELNNAQPPEGYVAVSRSLETIMEDSRCKIVCKQEFMAAPVPVKPVVSEASIPRTPPWVTYCSLVLQLFVFLLVALLTICTMIINYDRLMAIWDPSYEVLHPVRVVEIEDPTGFELLQRWLGDLWQSFVNLVSSGKQSTK